MRKRKSIFLALTLIIACQTNHAPKAEYWNKSSFNSLLTSFKEKPELEKYETRLWIVQSSMGAEEMYKVDDEMVYVKKLDSQTNILKFDSLSIADEKRDELYTTINRLNKISSPTECYYCNQIADGTIVIYESWKDGDLIIKERNLADLDYQGLILESGLGNKDELRLIFDLIETLKTEKQATTSFSHKPSDNELAI